MQTDPIYFRDVAEIQRSILANTSYGIYQQLRNPGVLSASRAKGPEGRLSVAPGSGPLLGRGRSHRAFGLRPLASAGLSGRGRHVSAGSILQTHLRHCRSAALGQPAPRVSSGGLAAWVYSSAADVTSSCGTWTEEKGE